jgi:hypothetical protein
MPRCLPHHYTTPPNSADHITGMQPKTNHELFLAPSEAPPAKIFQKEGEKKVKEKLEEKPLEKVSED